MRLPTLCAALLALEILGSGPAAAQIVIESGDCVGWGAWIPPGTPPGAVAGGESPLGLPPPGCQFVHNHADQAPLVVDSAHLFTTHTYSPFVDGEIEVVQLAVDDWLLYRTNNVAVSLGFALRQDGEIFTLPFEVAPGSAWQHVAHYSAGAYDFDDPYAGGVQHPDFGPTGGEIEFGLFVRSVRSGGTSGSFILITDNLRVEVDHYPTPPKAYFDTTDLLRGADGSWNLLTPVYFPEHPDPQLTLPARQMPTLLLDRPTPYSDPLLNTWPVSAAHDYDWSVLTAVFPQGTRLFRLLIGREVRPGQVRHDTARISCAYGPPNELGHCLEPRQIELWAFDRQALDEAGIETLPCAYCTLQGLIRMVDGEGYDPQCFAEGSASAAATVSPRLGASSPVATLRALRDQLMATTAAGRYYTRLYETLSPAIVKALLERPSIGLDALAAQGPWLDAFAAQLAGQGDAAVITQAMAGGLLGVLDRLAAVGDPELRRTLDFERARLHLDTLAGSTMAELWDRANTLGGPQPCAATDQALCLGNGRFRVEADWTRPNGNVGVGHATALSGDTGTFWFFDPANVEVIFKVHDGRPLNGNWWAFYGALSNVAYTLTVTDTATGSLHAYANPQGTLASVGDVHAFADDPGAAASRGEAAATPIDALDLAPGAGGAAEEGARAAAGDGGLGPRTGSCAPSPAALCLNGGRFRVTAVWRDFHGRTGNGTAVGLTADTGYFWFFAAANVEVVAKVLDGRPVNGKFWVFYGALSNVEYTLTVEDTMTGAVRTYPNPSGTFASVADTSAF
jgi:hypothetical protein